MAELLLTFHCAVQDTAAVADAIRSVSRAPSQLVEESVRGWDFGDASTAERVTGLLRRNALELIADEEELGGLVRAAANAKRVSPLRWHAVPVAARGRIA